MDARCAPVVAGPPRPITTEQLNGPVAQSAERRSYKADVVRAIRTGTTNIQTGMQRAEQAAFQAVPNGFKSRPVCQF